FAPAAAPSFHEPAVATPDASVVAFAPVTEPPPDAVANVTATLATGVAYLSTTRTEGALDTVVSTVAVWLSPPAAVIEATAPAVPVAWNVTVVRPVALAVRVFAPTLVPSVQEPTVAPPF